MDVRISAVFVSILFIATCVATTHAQSIEISSEEIQLPELQAIKERLAIDRHLLEQDVKTLNQSIDALTFASESNGSFLTKPKNSPDKEVPGTGPVKPPQVPVLPPTVPPEEKPIDLCAELGLELCPNSNGQRNGQ